MQADGLYVYGVLSASEPTGVPVTGVQDADVDAVVHCGLAVLVSPLSGRTLGAAREVRAHWRVLAEASAAATVLPARFGTVMRDAESVRERLIEPNAERLQQLLSEVAGCVQLSVKGDYEEQALMKEIVASSPGVASLRTRLRAMPEAAGYYGRIRLGEMVAAEVNRVRDRDTQAALAALLPHSISSRQEEVAHQNAAFNLAFLVTRDAQARFSERVVELADQFGDRIDLRYIGPLPPYSFAEAELSEEAQSWA